METVRMCPSCGAKMAADAPQGLCPECLLKTGLSSQPGPGAADDAAVRPRELPRAGAQFGGYRIVRELGRGGMGAVYEAEHLETGRRVALKVLGHQLDSPDARKRFLREGRLAASINHPNSVYIYGTEEIDGTPVIAMEVIAGGTLQERVQRQGPRPVAEAVDAILQVIAGLEAAQAIGILHRDVKPSNCFVDADGTVKVGDFGLSISAAALGETNLTLQGTVLGTPAFCSPEQLRGEELNARSDLYSVGVTLFYLLTAHTPFEAKNMVQLVANVVEQPAPSPRKYRSDLPPALARAVLRCLEKSPTERFKTYDELRQALAPFSATTPTPAALGRRFLAGAVDLALVGFAGMTVNLLAFGGFLPFMDASLLRSPKLLAGVAVSFAAMLLYYALLEGLRGASLGKALCGLRVAGPDRNPPGVWKALVRALVVVVLPGLPYWVAFGFDPVAFLERSNVLRYGVTLVYYLALALLFCTARRRNGFAALQDLLTNTRVIRKPAYQARPVLAASCEPAPTTETLPMVGPYHVLEALEKTAASEWLLGYDTRLLRKVWIRVVPPGTPPLAPAVRNLGRVGRLRWLAGRRASAANWDAFEGVTGQALAGLIRQRQPWSQVRFWLLDLANELSAAEKDGTLPAVLALDRGWITADGRAKLLDFPAPGVASVSGPLEEPASPDGVAGERSLEGWRFLKQIAAAALEGRPVSAVEASAEVVRTPLPLHARTFLEKLPALPSADTIVAALKPLMQQVATVSRWRRAGLIAGCVAFPLLAGLGFVAGTRLLDQWQRRQPDVAALGQLLQQRAARRLPWAKGRAGPDDRTFAIYIASHFRPTITNAPVWSSLFALSMISGESRHFAEQSLVAQPEPTAQEITEAAAALKPQLSAAEGFNVALKPWFPPLVAGVSLILYVGLPALLAALLCRGGLVLRLCGVAVVRTQGARASRLRVFWRGLIAWAPVLLAPLVIALLRPALGGFGSAALAAALVFGLALGSLALPDRGLPDRLAGTCLVPR